MNRGIMNYEEFQNYIKQALAKIFIDSKYYVEDSKRELFDDEYVDVIHVREKFEGGSTGRGFQIKPYFDDYTSGKPLGEIVLEMVKSIEDTDSWVNPADILSMSDFDTSWNKIIFRPLNYDRNRKILKRHMFKVVGDIALVIYMLLRNNGDMMATAKVEKNTIKKWNLPENYVFEWAMRNTAAMFRPYFIPMEFLMSNNDYTAYPDVHKYFMEPSFELQPSRLGAYALFADNNVNNASIVFYNGVLHRLAEILKDDLYFMIGSMSYAVLHTKKSISLEKLRMMARKERHNPYADPDEFLSDGVYLYSAADGTLKMV
jgi:hypothetical protein